MAETLTTWLAENPLLAQIAYLAALLLAALLLYFLMHGVLVASVRRLARRSRTVWDDALVDNGVFGRLAHIPPALLVYYSAAFLPGLNDTLALLVQADGNKALQAELTGLAVTAGPLGSVTADSVTVKYNSDATNPVVLTPDLDIDGVSAPLNVGAGVVSFKAINLQADFADFVHVGGDFGFRKTEVSPGVSQIEATANNLEVRLELGAVFSASATGYAG